MKRLSLFFLLLFPALVRAESVQELYTSAMAKANKGELDAALADLDKAIKQNPDSLPCYDIRAQIRQKKNDYAGAIADYTKIVDLLTTRIAQLREQGVANTEFNFDLSIASFAEVHALTPYLAEAYRDRAFAHFLHHDKDETLADYSKSLEFKPDPYVYICRGNARADKGDYDGAIQDCTKAIELKPDAYAFTSRANARIAKNNLEGALADMSRAIDLEPDAYVYVQRAGLRAKLNNPDGALNDFAKALELNPKYIFAWHERGCLHYDRHEWDAAQSDFKKETELEADRDYAQLRLFLVRANLGKKDAATQELQSYLKTRKPKPGEDWPAKLAAFLLGQLPEADLLQAADNPDKKKSAGQHCEAYFYAGALQLLANNKQVAADDFQKAVATAATHYTEYQSATAELKRLK